MIGCLMFLVLRCRQCLAPITNSKFGSRFDFSIVYFPNIREERVITNFLKPSHFPNEF